MPKASKVYKNDFIADQSEIEKIINWLSTFPDFAKTFDVSKDTTEQLIDFVGTDEIEHERFIRSGEKISYRNNYVLQVSKPFRDVLQRKGNADFLTNLQKWVRQQSLAGAVPILGNHGRQNAYVDSQEFVDAEASDNSAVYQVQLHIEYTVISY